MNAESKAILLDLAGAVEDLRANQYILLGLALGPKTVGAAQKTKNVALKSGIEDFDKLRKRIEELA
jgi:hypothetical protein